MAGIEQAMPIAAQETDQASAALISDLKQRGMLDDTLVIWGGEFGRTPMGQGSGRGTIISMRFSLWMAGGGIKGGVTYGATDELGYKSVENVMDHARPARDNASTCAVSTTSNSESSFQGLDAKLTGVEPARIVKEVTRA